MRSFIFLFSRALELLGQMIKDNDRHERNHYPRDWLPGITNSDLRRHINKEFKKGFQAGGIVESPSMTSLDIAWKDEAFKASLERARLGHRIFSKDIVGDSIFEHAYPETILFRAFPDLKNNLIKSGSIDQVSLDEIHRKKRDERRGGKD